MALFLGIDGGGTKTRCVLGNENVVLASAFAGGCNIVRLGEAAARASLHGVVRQVCEAGKVSAREIDSVCLGAAGAARPEISGKLRVILAELGLKSDARVEVTGDASIALEAAFGCDPGVIAIAGTGSIVYGRDPAGQIARAGGWGFAISDEGSGHWIGRHAVSAVLRARDQGHETALTALVLEAWHINGVDTLIQCANSTPPPEFPRLFRTVARAASEGDEIARTLLARAGRELAALAGIVIRRIAPTPPYIQVATTGSVFRQSEEVRRGFCDELRGSFPEIAPPHDGVDPVMGALALARQQIRSHL